MTDSKKEIDQDKGDELLKRMLKTSPKPKKQDDAPKHVVPLAKSRVAEWHKLPKGKKPDLS